MVREINLSLIMNCLREHAPISRAALAEMTGLNKSTVSSLINELTAHQFIRELGLSSSPIGRPPRLLELNPVAGYLVSAEIGVDFISIICANFAAEILWQHRESTRELSDQSAILERALQLLRQANEIGPQVCSECHSLLGIAIGIPGLVEQNTGKLLFAPNLKWADVSLQSIVRTVFPNTVVFVDNEANLAALGEYYFGAAKGYREVLYISVGVGLGGAMVIDGSLFTGKTGFAGEFGHMTMDPNGEPCNCGNQGCWETQVSQSAVFRYIRKAIAIGETSLLSDLTQGNFDRLTIEMVVSAADQGDVLALKVIERVGRHLGIGIASLVNALNPDLVVFGGILSIASKYLLAAIHSELEQRALRWNAQATQVVFARHRLDACVLGGIARIYQSILSNPNTIIRYPA